MGVSRRSMWDRAQGQPHINCAYCIYRPPAAALYHAARQWLERGVAVGECLLRKLYWPKRFGGSSAPKLASSPRLRLAVEPLERRLLLAAGLKDAVWHPGTLNPNLNDAVFGGDNAALNRLVAYAGSH